jgi:hypothetical protein
MLMIGNRLTKIIGFLLSRRTIRFLEPPMSAEDAASPAAIPTLAGFRAALVALERLEADDVAQAGIAWEIAFGSAIAFLALSAADQAKLWPTIEREARHIAAIAAIPPRDQERAS